MSSVVSESLEKCLGDCTVSKGLKEDKDYSCLAM